MTNSNIYKRYRFSPEIIHYAVWRYFRFYLSHRDIKELFAQRVINVIHESNRLWCNNCGFTYVARLRKKHQGYGDTFSSMRCLSKLMENWWQATLSLAIPRSRWWSHGCIPSKQARFGGSKAVLQQTAKEIKGWTTGDFDGKIEKLWLGISWVDSWKNSQRG
jgi:hypothetical protein